MKTKECTRCLKRKTAAHFSKNSGGKEGLRSRCRACCTMEMANWRKTGKINVTGLKGRSLAQLKFVIRQAHDEISRRKREGKLRSQA